MCQTLHIPYKHQPTDVQMKQDWLSIERWANHIVECCCYRQPFVTTYHWGGDSGDDFIDLTTGGVDTNPLLLVSQPNDGDEVFAIWYDGNSKLAVIPIFNFEGEG